MRAIARFPWTALLILWFAGAAFSQTSVNIHAIQANLPNSPYLGQPVSTEGIVTAVLADGFYIENSSSTPTCTDPTVLNCWDTLVSTSEGIYVFTGTAPDPAYATVGNLVSVTGTVTISNTSADTAAQGTEIQVNTTPTRVDAITYPLPATVPSSALAQAVTGVFGQWLEFEGMRINVSSLTTTSSTSGTVAQPLS